MKAKQDLKYLHLIEKIVEASRDSKLEPELFAKIQTELNELATFFKITPNQALLVANIFSLNYKGDTVDTKDLSEYFDCTPVKILMYTPDIEVLLKKGLLLLNKSNHRLKLAFANNQYYLSEELSESIVKGSKLILPKQEPVKFKTLVELMEVIIDLINEATEEPFYYFDMKQKSERILKSNRNFGTINTLLNLNLESYQNLLFILVCWKTLNGKETADLESLLKSLFKRRSDKINALQKMINGVDPLFSGDILEIIEAPFFNDTEVKLAPESLKWLENDGVVIGKKDNKGNNVLTPDSITQKELFYNSSDLDQINMITNIIQPDSFSRLQTRLDERKLPKGVAVLLYGAPGTGKTESVYQLAKQTGRSVMCVDISASKSMWFGESEKVVKRIFTNYTTLCKTSEITPILLFNEADAILGKRRESNSTNTSQTENAIQNIILEEMERFEGILFATTNLATNLDAAFERRFLFKLYFTKPELKVSAKIWQSKLAKLSSEECDMLAARFDFSGGQIENISRKYSMAEIINGTTPTYDEIVAFCKEESIAKVGGKTIGF